MDAKQNFFDLHVERFRLFESQDLENGDFDVVFDFNGKKLHANKFMLCTVSTTFQSMFADRWRKTVEPISVTDYSYEAFKEFLTFIYSGECSLTNDNIFALVDIAEFYGVAILKNECDKFLAKMELDLDDVPKMIDLSNKYSLQNLKIHVGKIFITNLSSFINTEKLQNLQKSALKFIVEQNSIVYGQEELFGAIYNWAEKQATEKQKVEPNLNLNETIKSELTEILPFVKFEAMKAEFLFDFVVRKSFLFSGDELSNILSSAWKAVYVKVVHGNGKMMKGQLKCDNMQKVADEIKSMKDPATYFEEENVYFWNSADLIPLAQSKLIKTEKCEWYLVYDESGDFAIKHRDQLIDEEDFLLAEMVKEVGFVIDDSCKIEICRFE